MRCAIVISLCVLMMVCISDARSLKKERTFSGFLKSKLLAQLKSRNINLVKKGDTESEDSERKGGPGHYSLIGLHVTHYVSTCLANFPLMQMVKDEAWELLENGEQDSFAIFEALYSGADYFDCLRAAFYLYKYEDEPEIRDELDGDFTLGKEVDKCMEMDGLKEKLLGKENLPAFVQGVAEYMHAHCGIRMAGKKSTDGGLFSTAAFDAISYAGYCIADETPEKPMDENCKGAVDGVEQYYEAFANIVNYYETFTEEEQGQLWESYHSVPEAKRIIDALFESYGTLIYLDSVFEHHNREYTCKTLLENVHTVDDMMDEKEDSVSKSELSKKMIGLIYGLVEGIEQRECRGIVDSKSESSDEDVSGSFDSDDSKEKMQVLKKMLTNLLSKK